MAGHIAGALPPNPYLLFLSWCPSFLPLMEEKKQKKIKASPRPGKLAGYLTNFLASVGLAGMSTNRYQEKLPCLGRDPRWGLAR